MNAQGTAHLRVREKRLLDVVGEGLQVEQVATGFGFTEGPVWDRSAGRLIFSDMKHDHMRAFAPGKGVATFRKPSNKGNGNAFDREGRLITCEHATSRLVREERDGSFSVLASQYQGKELNSPNDLTLKSDGTIYFSDPTFGRIREDVGVPRALTLDFRGVYCVAPDGSGLRLLADDFEQPNGLCFSPDESRLFVNDTPRLHIRVFDVRPDGSVGGGKVWAELTGEGEGRPDGMKLDSAGFLYCTGPGGVHVFDPAGVCLGVILTPERPTNFAWGEGDRRSLYITAQTSLYRAKVKTPGR